MDGHSTDQALTRPGSTPQCQVPGCHAEADINEPGGLDQNGSPATMLYLCSEHYLVHLRDRAVSQTYPLTDGRPNWMNSPNDHDPGPRE